MDIRSKFNLEVTMALAQGFCTAKNEKKIMDVDLVNDMADKLWENRHAILEVFFERKETEMYKPSIAEKIKQNILDSYNEYLSLDQRTKLSVELQEFILTNFNYINNNKILIYKNK